MKHSFKLIPLILIVGMFAFSHQASARQYKVNIRGAVGNLVGIVHVPDAVKVDSVVAERIYTAPGETCPVAILCHGLTGSKNSKLIAAVADSLEHVGIAAVRFDYNAHGESEGDFSKMTVVNEVEDTYEIFKYVKSLPFTGKIALLGHSQGGLVCGLFASWVTADLECLVLMAPGAVILDGSRSGNFLGESFDPANPPAIINFWKKDFGIAYIKTAQNLPIWEEAAKFTKPTLLVHAYDDKTVPYFYSEKYLEVMPNAELISLEDNDHSFRKDRPAAVLPTVAFLQKYLN